MENFQKFGYVFDNKKLEPYFINNGSCLKYDFEFKLPPSNMYDNYHFKLYVAKKTLPLPINFLEKHPKGFQLFFPISGSPFVVVVAPDTPLINCNDIKAFYVPGDSGIVINQGVWHHPLISLRDGSKFFVIENDVPENCEIQFIFKPFSVCLHQFK